MRRGLLVSLVLLPFFVFAANGLPDGCHPASAAEAQGKIKVGEPVCPGDAAVGITANAGQAKAYLSSIVSFERNSQAPPDKAHIDALNNAFAQCAANFLKAYIDRYGPVKIVSAFRCGPNSPKGSNCDPSENGRAGGATNSNHQLGTAMDINPVRGTNSSYETLRSFAQANPGYGVAFHWPTYQGKVDKPHMQAINPRSPSCTGVQGTPVAPSAPAAAPLDGAVRRALGQDQTPVAPLANTTPQQQQMCTLPGGYTVPCDSIKNAQAQAAPTAAPAAAPASPAPSGAAPSTPASVPAQTPVGTLPPLPSASSLPPLPIPAQNSTSSASVLNQLNLIANPGLNPTAGNVATSVNLVITGDEAAHLAQAPRVPVSDSSHLQPFFAEQFPETFTSSDLAGNGTVSASPQSPLLKILSDFKLLLLKALDYLRPFGGTSLDMSGQSFAE